MGVLTALYRHPIKAIGVEPLDHVSLTAGQTMPGDRLWAVMHEASNYDPADGWGKCMNFVRGASSARLMAVKAKLKSARLELWHPDIEPLFVSPDAPEDAARVVAWVAQLCDPKRAKPVRLIKATKQGMTDRGMPWVSILSDSSLAELSGHIGKPLARERFRGNIWIDGFTPWAEFDWIGQEISIGGARLRVAEPITRCVATTVNPDTGISDMDTLGTLEREYDHQDFGVVAEVIESGPIRIGDKVSA